MKKTSTCNKKAEPFAVISPRGKELLWASSLFLGGKAVSLSMSCLHIIMELTWPHWVPLSSSCLLECTDSHAKSDEVCLRHIPILLFSEAFGGECLRSALHNCIEELNWHLPPSECSFNTFGLFAEHGAMKSTPGCSWWGLSIVKSITSFFWCWGEPRAVSVVCNMFWEQSCDRCLARLKFWLLERLERLAGTIRPNWMRVWPPGTARIDDDGLLEQCSESEAWNTKRQGDIYLLWKRTRKWQHLNGPKKHTKKGLFVDKIWFWATTGFSTKVYPITPTIRFDMFEEHNWKWDFNYQQYPSGSKKKYNINIMMEKLSSR